jgi:hypothetical protein
MSQETTNMQSNNSIVPSELLKVLSIRSKPGLVCPEDIRSRIVLIRSRVESFRGVGTIRKVVPEGGFRRPNAFSSTSASGNRGNSHSGNSGNSGNSHISNSHSGNSHSNSGNSGNSGNGNGNDNFWNRPANPSVSPSANTNSQNRHGLNKGHGPNKGHDNGSGNRRFFRSQPIPLVQVSPAASENRFKELDSDGHEEIEKPEPPTSTIYVRFRSKFKKEANTEVELEDRILGHIRAKINKFSAQNYKKVLNFLRQNMDSEEKEFLEQFMELIFSKAAEEDTFVALYAQLLADLTPEFPYLRDEMQKLFLSYLEVFRDAEGKEDTTSVEYGKFLDAQKRKNHRRGYSLFIAQITTHSLINEKDLLTTVLAIAKSLISSTEKAEEKLLVEELADCLTNILTVAHKPLSVFPELKEMTSELRKLVEKNPATQPGMSFKARFALMDCLGI